MRFDKGKRRGQNLGRRKNCRGGPGNSVGTQPYFLVTFFFLWAQHVRVSGHNLFTSRGHRKTTALNHKFKLSVECALLTHCHRMTVVLILLQGPGTDPRAIDIIRRGVLEGRSVPSSIPVFDVDDQVLLIWFATSGLALLVIGSTVHHVLPTDASPPCAISTYLRCKERIKKNKKQ